jgi:hypothetical protein
MAESEGAFAQIRLAGDRFTGGRLPVDALEEIQRYQSLVVEAARREWVSAHPDEEVPEDFTSSLKLVITKVEDGSAQVLLEREAPETDAYRGLFDDARDEVLRELSALLDTTEPITAAPLFEQKDFRALGSSLQPGDSIRISSVTPDGARATNSVAVTETQVVETFPGRVKESNRERSRRAKENLYLKEQTIAGRLVALNAERKTFALRSLHYGELNGAYTKDEFTADLKAVLNSSARAPVIRLRADLQFRDGVAWRIRGASDVELLEVDGQPWTRKLVELASLGPDWDGEFPGASMISFASLDAARELVLQLVQAGGDRPGIFPTEEGGISLEWANSASVASIEVSPDATSFEFFRLPAGETEGIHREGSTMTEALNFAREVSIK